MSRGWHPPAMLALLVMVLILGAWVLLGMRLGGEDILPYTFALPGAHGLPGADVFNVLVFVLPGGLMVVFADSLRRQLPELAGGLSRIGCGLALLAALAWVAQGLFPLETRVLFAHEGSRWTWLMIDEAGSRWHVSAWTLWWMAAASASVLMALVVPGMRVSGTALLVALLLPAALPSGTWMTVLTQPLAVLLWGVWMWSGMKALRRPEATCSH